MKKTSIFILIIFLTLTAFTNVEMSDRRITEYKVASSEKKIEVDSVLINGIPFSLKINKGVLDSISGLELNQENVYSLCVLLGIQFPDIVTKQAVIESGNFKSQLTTRGNNLFGMRRATRRPTTSSKKILFGYATYSNWTHSVIDYYIWQSQMIKKYPVKSDYFSWLKSRNYFGVSLAVYKKHVNGVKLKNIKTKVNQ